LEQGIRKTEEELQRPAMSNQLKLTPYHEEQNRRTAEANKKMPRATRESFKKQAQELRDFRRAHEQQYNSSNQSG
jgi:hypothetical protein